MKPYAVPASLTILVVLLLVAVCTTQSGSMSPATMAVPGVSPAAGTSDLKQVTTDGNASLYRVGNISVIRLEGTYREIGRQYGRLMGKDIATAQRQVHPSPQRMHHPYLHPGRRPRQGNQTQRHEDPAARRGRHRDLGFHQ